jgi:FixJ family two-component response regulator
VSSDTKTYVAVIDDDESFCRSVDRLLRAAGFRSITYQSAEDFLEDAKRPRFDCLLLDIKLPGISGLELQQQVQSYPAPIPVIFVTSHDSPQLRKTAQNTGASAYFCKTDPGARIIDCIRRLALGASSTSDHSNQRSML